MRILVLKPYAARTRELEHCQRVARPDTQVDFADIRDTYPLKDVQHRCFRHKAIEAAVERILQAEEEGYDAVCISCGLDPGLYEARELVNIPVTGAFEAGGHLACTMGHRFSVITTKDNSVPHMEERAILYGFAPKLASIRHLGTPGHRLFGDITPEETIVARVHQIARRCVEEDGAEVILLTATLAGVMFTDAVNPPVAEIGAPVVDALLAAFKMAEMMVDLRKLAGLPPASRIGSFQAPYEPDYRRLRAFYGLPLRRGLAPDS